MNCAFLDFIWGGLAAAFALAIFFNADLASGCFERFIQANDGFALTRGIAAIWLVLVGVFFLMDSARSPFVHGLWRHSVVVSPEFSDSRHRLAILAHEFAHARDRETLTARIRRGARISRLKGAY